MPQRVPVRVHQIKPFRPFRIRVISSAVTLRADTDPAVVVLNRRQVRTGYRLALAKIDVLATWPAVRDWPSITCVHAPAKRARCVAVLVSVVARDPIAMIAMVRTGTLAFTETFVAGAV